MLGIETVVTPRRFYKSISNGPISIVSISTYLYFEFVTANSTSTLLIPRSLGLGPGIHPLGV